MGTVFDKTALGSTAEDLGLTSREAAEVIREGVAVFSKGAHAALEKLQTALANDADPETQAEAHKMVKAIELLDETGSTFTLALIALVVLLEAAEQERRDEAEAATHGPGCKCGSFGHY